MPRSARRAAAIAAVLAGLALLGTLWNFAAAGQAKTPALRHQGRWIVDPQGRVLVIHGVNMPSKSLPAYPSALGFGDDDATLLAELGFNAVRLTVERYAVEPSPGHFDASYVSQIGQTVAMLASHGILSLLDFHQDDYGPTFQDNGYPDWMTQTDGQPNLFFEPFPTGYLANPALEHAFDHLWANDPAPGDGKPLQADDAAILAYVAGALQNEPGLLGYEIINEPWPGSVYPTCIGPTTGCPAFDQGPFSAYYGRTLPAVRAADPSHLIWYEPLVTFNQGIPTYVNPPPDRNRGFAFHDYPLCQSGSDPAPDTSAACQSEDDAVQANALSRAAATGDALLETEFGATMNTAELNRHVTQYDAGMLPWMFWSYTRYIVKLDSSGKLDQPATDPNNVNWPLVDVLARPYPQLISGTPESWSFDPSAKTFRLTFSASRADGRGHFAPGSVTDVFVPSVQYPAGYGVVVAGGTVISAPGAAVLEVSSCPGATTINVTVTATSGVSGSC